MDIDSYSATNGPQWRSLEKLSRKRHLNGEEIDEMVRLYQQTSSDLAALTSTAGDPDQILALSRLVAKARGRISGAREQSLKSLGRFFTLTLPLALYRIGPLFLLLWIFSATIALVAGVYAVNHPEYLASRMPEYELRQYAQDAFKAYYTNYPAPDFAALVWTNNAKIAVLMIATFFTGVIPIYILISNFANLGVAGAIMYKYGSMSVFFGLITPHGLLEMSCIVLSCAVSIKLMWTVLVPGEVTRVQALSQAGRQFVPLSIGLILLLGISGLEEGFLTPSALLPPVKIAVAVLVFVLLTTWVVVFARRAQKLKLGGDVSQSQAGYW